MTVNDDLQVTLVAWLIMDISLGLSFMFFVQAKAVAGAGICTGDDRLRQLNPTQVTSMDDMDHL